MSSTRLPGKVLRPILGIPMLQRQLERVKHSRLLDKVIVVTSDDRSDDPLAECCLQNECSLFRGSLLDVLDRSYQATKGEGAEYVVRLTADCPLADPALIDEAVDCCLKGGFDYLNNCDPPTFPDGLDVEVMRFEALATAWRESVLPSHREHVTLFIRQNPGLFKIGRIEHFPSLGSLRWTVDEPEDLELIRTIYEALYPTNPRFGMKDVVDFLRRNPKLMLSNSNFARNEGLATSLNADRRFSRGSEGGS